MCFNMAKRKVRTNHDKPTNIERDLRVNKVANEILQRRTTSSIIALIKKEFSVSRATAFWYLNDAWKLIYDNQKIDIDKEIARLIGSLDRLYQKALAKEDIRAALLVIQEISKIKGIYDTTNITNVQLNFNSLDVPKTDNEYAKLKDEYEFRQKAIKPRSD